MENAYNSLSELFAAIANAIRAKKQSTDPIVADDFPAEIDGIATVDKNTVLTALRSSGADVSDDDDMTTLINKLSLFVNPYEKLTSVVGETGEDKLGTYTWGTANDTPNPHNYYVLRPGVETIPNLQLDYGASYDLTNYTQAVRRRKMDGSYASISVSNGASRVICPETMPNAINPNGKVNTVSITGLTVTPPVALYLPKYTANNAHNSNWIAGSPASKVQEQIVVAPEGMCWPAHLHRLTLMSADTIVAILNNLADISDTDLDFTLTLGTTNLAKLTEEQKNIAYAKGWDLA